MRRRIFAVAFAWLAIASRAEGESISFGPQIAFPVGRDISDRQLGIDAGLTVNVMQTSYFGVGADLIYHRWPASPGYQAAFDRYLVDTRFQVIDGSSWAFTALQWTAHLRLAAPRIEPHGAWLQIGMGIYRLNHHLEPPSWEGSPVRVIGLRTDNIELVPGWYGTVGFDVRTNSSTGIGLDASYHHLWMPNKRALLGGNTGLPPFSTFTVGMHLLFGWRSQDEE